MEEFYMPTLSHFENGNGWSGSRLEMCYEVEEPVDGQLRAVTWYPPFSRDYAQEVAEASFPMTDEGLVELVTWLQTTAEDMTNHPTITPEERRAYYLRCRGE